MVQLEKIEKRSIKQDRMDLNELTPEFDYNFLDDQYAKSLMLHSGSCWRAGASTWHCIKFQNNKISADFYNGEAAVVNNVGSLKTSA